MARRLPIFPLGTVLLPGQVLPLHIFEPRYRVLMRQLTAPGAVPEFGVVLIERGHEVGGGDERVAAGTVAQLVKAQELPDGRWVAAVAGMTRFRVRGWLPDDPYPRAEIADLDDDDSEVGPHGSQRVEEAQRLVRRALALATELSDVSADAVFLPGCDPLWELCGRVPIGPLDRQRLLEAPRPQRVELLVELADQAAALLAFRLGGR
jgi:Lon protease-like protein